MPCSSCGRTPLIINFDNLYKKNWRYFFSGYFPAEVKKDDIIYKCVLSTNTTINTDPAMAAMNIKEEVTIATEPGTIFAIGDIVEFKNKNWVVIGQLMHDSINYYSLAICDNEYVGSDEMLP